MGLQHSAVVYSRRAHGLAKLLAKVKEDVEAEDLSAPFELTQEILAEICAAPEIRAAFKAEVRQSLGESVEPRVVLKAKFGECTVEVYRDNSTDSRGLFLYHLSWKRPNSFNYQRYAYGVSDLAKKIRKASTVDGVPDFTPEVAGKILDSPELKAELKRAAMSSLGPVEESAPRFDHKQVVQMLLDLDSFEPGPVSVTISSLESQWVIRTAVDFAKEHGGKYLGTGSRGYIIKFDSMASVKAWAKEFGHFQFTANRTVGTIIMHAGDYSLYCCIRPWDPA